MESASLIKAVVPLITALLMLGVGLGLAPAHFRALSRARTAAVVALSLQLLLLPAIALTLIQLFSPPSEIALGLLILAICPGGSTSNLFTYLANGNTALSISLTATTKLVSVATIPLMAALLLPLLEWQNTAVDIAFKPVFAKLLLIVILPVVMGMIITAKWPGFAQKQRARVKWLGLFFLTTLIAVSAAREQAQLMEMVSAAGWYASGLCLTAFLSAYFIARAFKLDDTLRTTVSLETIIQSSGMAIVLCLGVFNSTVAAFPAALYTLVMYIAAGTWVIYKNTGVLLRKRSASQEFR